MKSNPFVAIHCWKALSSRIVLRPLKISFIKGPVSNCIWKSQSLLYTHLWKCRVLSKYWVQCAAQFEIIVWPMLTSKSYADFVMQKSFKGRSTQPGTNLLNILLRKNYVRQNRCNVFDANRQLSKYAVRQTQFFERTLHFQSKHWEPYM